MTTKDPTIVTLLSALNLERRGWIELDHWDADTCAVGIARRSDPRHLVYVSTFNKAADRYDYECETPSGLDAIDYVTNEKGENVTYAELLDVLVRHLG